VSSYFQRGRARTVSQPKIRALIEMIADLDTIEVKSEPEALLLEGKLIKQWRPRYNTDFTDDKRFLLVRVDLGEELPRFRLTRLKKEDNSRYFGPFAHSGLLRKTLAQMRRQFGILLGDATPEKLPDGTWRLYDDVREELYGAGRIVSTEDYRRRIEDACTFLEGKSREWLETLRGEMTSAAGRQEFEKAAELRDMVFALEKTLAKTRHFERTDPTRPPATTRRSNPSRSPSISRRLRARWSASTSRTSPAPSSSPRWCTSPTAGRTRTNTAASRSRASSATTTTAPWRRSSAAATVDSLRRKNLPDLIVIDGGRGQIGAALKAFVALDATAARPHRPREDNTRPSFSPTNAPR
jgi:excinuclease ABC subunit C